MPIFNAAWMVEWHNWWMYDAWMECRGVYVMLFYDEHFISLMQIHDPDNQGRFIEGTL